MTNTTSISIICIEKVGFIITVVRQTVLKLITVKCLNLFINITFIQILTVMFCQIQVEFPATKMWII